MTMLVYAGVVVVSLITVLLIVLRLRSARRRIVALAIYIVVLAVVGSLVGWREYHAPERVHGRQIDAAVNDLGDTYILFRSLGDPDATEFDGAPCDRGTVHENYRYLQRTWRILQPVDFPTLEAALERDGYDTSPISNRTAVAYGFLANRGDLAIQVQSLETGVEVRIYAGPCVPRPTIDLAQRPAAILARIASLLPARTRTASDGTRRLYLT